MPNTTWKAFERRLARDYGEERTRGQHGPDFVIPLGKITYRAEAKKRGSRKGFETLLRWIVGRDITFVSFKHERDDDALVVMRKRVFDEIYNAAAVGAVCVDYGIRGAEHRTGVRVFSSCADRNRLPKYSR